MDRKGLVITDSASDISAADEKKYGIDILNYKVALGDEIYTSRVDFDNEKFYEMMAGYDGLPTTSQITTFQFQDYFEEKFEEGYTDLIFVLINSKGSATFGNAIYAKQLFFEEHPECKDKINIHLFDGASYTGGYGEVALEAAIMLQEGKKIEEITSYVGQKLLKRVIYFGMYSLKYAAKSGRIPSAAAFVGEALGLKPVMRIFDHAIVTAKKAHGEKRLIPTIADLVASEIAPNTPYSLVYGSDASVAEVMSKAMTERLGYPPVRSFQIGAAIAVNAGPKVVGVIFDSKD